MGGQGREVAPDEVAGLYIHIPFCRSRCIYCDFYSTTLPQAWQGPYVEALGREMEIRANEEAGKLGRIGTVYIGGGTPSLLTGEALERLFALVARHYRLEDGAEVTLEANPDDVTGEWVDSLKGTPVNRISMGVQSLDDNILRTLRRRHTAEQARRAVALLQEAGYTNLSLDLIYGLPGQGLAQFERDVREVLGMGVTHLSAYALQFEPGTALSAMRQRGELSEADEELSLACYERLMDLTAEAGMEHYEISNFALPGRRSRHNSSYWTEAPYVGLGAGAHSYDPTGHVRSFNCEDIRQYIEAVGHGRRPSTSEVLDETTRYNERVMLRLRTCEGLSLDELERDFGLDRRRYCERMAEPHILRGRVQKKAGEALCLTRSGLFVSDDIISDLLEVES